MNEQKIDWKECCGKRIAKSVMPDIDTVESLKKSSENKIKSSDELKMNETTSVSKFILAYDSLREMLEALCLIFGYNVTNHICLGELVKDLIKNFDYVSFDRFRYVRNGINYYGKKIGFEDGKEIIRKIFEMRKVIKKEVNVRIMHK